MKQKLVALSVLLFVTAYAWAQTNRTSRTNKRQHDRSVIDTTRQMDKLDSILVHRDSLRRSR